MINLYQRELYHHGIKGQKCTSAHYYDGMWHFMTMDKDEEYDPIFTILVGGYKVSDDGNVEEWGAPHPGDPEWDRANKAEYVNLLGINFDTDLPL